MKKFLLLFLALSLIGGAAFAQDLGLSAGLEFHVGVLNHESVDAMDTALLRPVLVWENDDLVDNLELYAEVGVPFWMNSWIATLMSEDNTPWLGVDLTLKGTYNLALTPEGTLSFILKSQSLFLAFDDEISGAVKSPAFGWSYTGGMYGIIDTQSWLKPGIRYTHALNGMSFFGQVNVPFLLFSGTDDEDPFDHVGLDFILGWNMNMDFGLIGAELELNNWIRQGGKSPDDFLNWLTITPFVEAGPLYAEIAFGVPLVENGIDAYGMTITPEVRYQIMDNLRAFVNLPIYGIASENDVMFGLGLGVMFSF